MRVQIELVCAPGSHEEIEPALQAAGKRLAAREDSVAVEVRAGEPLTAFLEFEMADGVKSRAADQVYRLVRCYAAAFCEDIAIRFPKG